MQNTSLLIKSLGIYLSCCMYLEFQWICWRFHKKHPTVFSTVICLIIFSVISYHLLAFLQVFSSASSVCIYIDIIFNKRIFQGQWWLQRKQQCFLKKKKKQFQSMQKTELEPFSVCCISNMNYCSSESLIAGTNIIETSYGDCILKCN